MHQKMLESLQQWHRLVQKERQQQHRGTLKIHGNLQHVDLVEFPELNHLEETLKLHKNRNRRQLQGPPRIVLGIHMQ